MTRVTLDQALLVSCSLNLAGADASGANVLSGYCAVFLNSYGLDVGIKLSFGMTVGVGNIVSGYLTLTTDLTFS